MVAPATPPLARSCELTYDDVCRLAQRTRAAGPIGLVVLDLNEFSEVATAAFARLVELRRELLRRGGDLRVTRLRSKALARFCIYRLHGVLPVEAWEN